MSWTSACDKSEAQYVAVLRLVHTHGRTATGVSCTRDTAQILQSEKPTATVHKYTLWEHATTEHQRNGPIMVRGCTSSNASQAAPEWVQVGSQIG